VVFSKKLNFLDMTWFTRYGLTFTSVSRSGKNPVAIAPGSDRA
jgi:hypothetical protein